MKKILALILAFCMILAVVACDNTTEEESTGGETLGTTESASLSETASESEAESEPASETASESESGETLGESASASETLSESASTSETLSESASVSETASESASTSETLSESASASETASETVSESELETDTTYPVENVGEIAHNAYPNVDYYLTVSQTELDITLYLDGGMDGFYPTGTRDKSSAVRIRLEETVDGYYVYFIKNAVKSYINISPIATISRISFDAEAKTVFTFEEKFNTLVTALGEKNLYLGMYDEQRNFSASDISYIEESFVAYLTVAGCDHQYIGDGNGHSSLSCAKCGTAAGKSEAHGETYFVNELGKRTAYCEDCNYPVSVELCDQNHWLSDKDGHWEGACEICGTPGGAKSVHGGLVADYFTETSYSLGCATCGYAYHTKTVPDTMTYMISGFTWGRGATTYYQLNGGHNRGTLTVEDGKAPYGSIVGITTDPATPKPGQILFNRSHSDAKGASDAQQYKLDVGEAKYLVIKIRTNDPAQHMSMAFSTTGKDGIKSVTLPLSRLTASKWGVIVIDLPTTCPEHYVKDAETDSYFVDSLYFTMNGFMSTTSIDVEYMAFVEGGFDDLDVLIDEEKAVYVAGSSVSEITIGESGSNENESGSETESKNESESESETEPSGDIPSPDGANYFIDPEFIKNNAGRQGTHDKTVMVEDGVTFVRIDNFVTAGTTDKWGGLNILNSDIGVTGQYLVMKIRVGKNGLNQTHLSMFIRSTGSGLAGNMQVDVKVAEDGEWHVIVIDLSTRVKDAATYFGKDADGQYHARYLQFRPFSNNQVGAQADDYTDIAYMAFFDSLDDLDDIIDETAYEWSVSKTESTLRNASDHTCVAHSAGTLQSATEGTATVYYAICLSCNERCYEKTVPESVSMYYTAQKFATGATTYHKAGQGSVQYDNQNGIVFGRESGNSQVLWHRAQKDVPSNTRSSQTTTMDVGNARFLVIRLRTSNIERTLKLNYSTTAKNSTTGEATAANESAFTADGTKGVKVGDIINLDKGYTTVTFPMASVTAGEWTTFVIDLNAVMGEYHAKMDGEDSYVVDTFYIDQNDKAGNLDVEYMAFVEGDWSDVYDFTGDKTVINVTTKEGAFETKTLGDAN